MSGGRWHLLTWSRLPASDPIPGSSPPTRDRVAGCGGVSPPWAFMDPAESPHVTFDLEWVPGGQSGHPPLSLAREYTQSAVPRTGVCTALDHVAHPLAHRPARPLLLPTGREANTINQLLADENMRKQNDYAEVRAKDWGPSPKGSGRQ